MCYEQGEPPSPSTRTKAAPSQPAPEPEAAGGVEHVQAAWEFKPTGPAQLKMKKGDVLQVARIAGIQGAKRTADLIPLCHPLPLDSVQVDLDIDEHASAVIVTATATTSGRTGVEMEALTAVSAAALTIYDMVKAVDRGVVIEGILLLEKEGGRSGHWVRGAAE